MLPDIYNGRIDLFLPTREYTVISGQLIIQPVLYSTPSFIINRFKNN